jgi:AcrR family transcriptional regulator
MTERKPKRAARTAVKAPTAGVVDGRRLTPKALATRNRIIECATELFAAQGYAAVTVRAIAAGTGLSSGAIYATFRGKGDLLIEAIRSSIVHDVEDIPVKMLDRPLPEIVAYQFSTSSDARRERFRKLLLEAAVAAGTDAEIRKQLGIFLQSRLDFWSDGHEEWKRTAKINRSVDARALATLLVSLDLGLAILSAFGIDAPDPKQSSSIVYQLMQSLIPAQATTTKSKQR